MANARLYRQDHAVFRCEYHLVWTPKYRGKVLVSASIKSEMRRIFKLIAAWKRCEVQGQHIGDEHIHLYILIPPKYSVAYVVNVLKSKSSAWIKKKNKQIPPGAFWCRGYFATTVGIDEWAIRNYIANQENKRSGQPQLPL